MEMHLPRTTKYQHPQQVNIHTACATKQPLQYSTHPHEAEYVSCTWHDIVCVRVKTSSGATSLPCDTQCVCTPDMLVVTICICQHTSSAADTNKVKKPSMRREGPRFL